MHWGDVGVVGEIVGRVEGRTQAEVQGILHVEGRVGWDWEVVGVACVEDIQRKEVVPFP